MKSVFFFFFFFLLFLLSGLRRFWEEGAIFYNGRRRPELQKCPEASEARDLVVRKYETRPSCRHGEIRITIKVLSVPTYVMKRLKKLLEAATSAAILLSK